MNDMLTDTLVAVSRMVKRNALNVGVDCHNFAPISLDEILFYRNAILKHYDNEVFVGV